MTSVMRMVVAALAACAGGGLACGDGGRPGGADAGDTDRDAGEDAASNQDVTPDGEVDTQVDAPPIDTDIDLGTATVSGNAFVFGPPGGRVVGATVTVLEHPGLSTTTDDEGYWALEVPNGRAATFLLDHPDHAPYQTATFDIGGDMERVTFQAPTWAMVDLLAGFAEVARDPDRCQIAATVTRRGHSLYDTDGLTHGEPDATVTLAPEAEESDGPIYFNLAAPQVIFPDRSLGATTDDGGVLFLNVTPGEYVMSATKEGATIVDARIVCRAGWIANAAPPWGLQVVEGGLEPRTE